MSTLIVEVARVRGIKPHPNADRLNITMVKGWEVITGLVEEEGELRSRYSEGDLVVYCPIDGVLPVELSDAMDVTKYLGKNGRVRTAKLRGVYSQGLIISTEFLPEDFEVEEGADAAEALGITKYIPPPQFSTDGLELPDDPRFVRYIEIENIKNFPDVLQVGEMVSISEKLHGTNCRFGWVDASTFLVGTHRRNISEDKRNLYWKVALEHSLRERLPVGYIFYGEIYGRKVQKLGYNEPVPTVRFFDIRSTTDNRYLGVDVFRDVCERLGLPMVPMLFDGKWSLDLMELGNGKSTLADHIREGIVIKPWEERWDRDVGRVVLKHLGEQYLMKKYA